MRWMQWLCRRMGWRLRGRLAAEAMSRRWLVEDDEGRHAEVRGGRRAAADADADAATAGVVSTPEARYPVLHMLKPGVPVAPPARGPSVVSLINENETTPLSVSGKPGARDFEMRRLAAPPNRHPTSQGRGAARGPPTVQGAPAVRARWCVGRRAGRPYRGLIAYALSLLASKNCILLKP